MKFVIFVARYKPRWTNYPPLGSMGTSQWISVWYLALFLLWRKKRTPFQIMKGWKYSGCWKIICESFQKPIWYENMSSSEEFSDSSTEGYLSDDSECLDFQKNRDVGTSKPRTSVRKFHCRQRNRQWITSLYPFPRHGVPHWRVKSSGVRQSSLLPIVLALFWALFFFASTFFYILSQKNLLAFFLIFDWLFV